MRHCAFVRGSAIIGKGAVVGNSTELKNVILFNKVQVPHYNYVGDSILGYRAHMGAGSITSNVKSDKTLVVVKGAEGEIETGLKKFGRHAGRLCGSGLQQRIESRHCDRKEHQYLSSFPGEGIRPFGQHLQRREGCGEKAVKLLDGYAPSVYHLLNEINACTR